MSLWAPFFDMDSFGKREHLCGRSDVEELWSSGVRFTLYPFRVVYRDRSGAGTGARVMVVARKKLYRHAVDRNLWRRLIREAYRRQKGVLAGKDVDVAITLIGPDFLPYEKVYERVGKIVEKVAAGC